MVFPHQRGKIFHRYLHILHTPFQTDFLNLMINNTNKIILHNTYCFYIVLLIKTTGEKKDKKNKKKQNRNIYSKNLYLNNISRVCKN